MRIVTGAVLAAVACLLLQRPVAASHVFGPSAVDLPAPESKDAGSANSSMYAAKGSSVQSESQTTQHTFVYVPPPSAKALDPLFYSDSFEFLPGADGQAAGKLVKPVWGVIPAAEAKATAANSEHGTKPNASATATATSSPASASSEPVATPTTKMMPEAQHSAATTSLDNAGASPKASFTFTPTPSPPAPTSTPKPTSNATQVAPVAEASQDDGIVSTGWSISHVAGNLQMNGDIEDPRFYRGSYVYDPETQALQPRTHSSFASASAASSSKPSDAPDGCTGSAYTSSGKCGSQNPGSSSSTFPRRGRAMYYNPGIMEQVLSFRLQAGHVSACPECVGHVALLGREDLNRKVWIEWADGDVEGPFLVIDVAAKQHVASLLSRNWVVDVDYQTAMRRGMNRPLPVTVWDRRPVAMQSTAPGFSLASVLE